MEQTLKLDKLTNKMVASIQIEVEREIFNRLLDRYLTDYNVDRSNLEEYAEALYNVSKVSRWLDHKRTEVVIPEKPKDVVKAIVNNVSAALTRTLEEPIQEPKIASGYRSVMKLTHMTKERADEFRVKLLAAPVDAWESMLTPLLTNEENGIDRRRVYYIRYDEKRIIDQLKKELEPVKPEKLQVIRDAVNNGRNR